MVKVDLYIWPTCPYCVRAKSLLDSEGITYNLYDISGDRNKLNELKKITGSGSVPQIFVNEEFIGGCDDLVLLHRNNEFDKVFK